MPTAISLIGRLFAADQAARIHHPSHGTPDYVAMREQDAERRAQLRALLANKEVNDPLALYRAAMIFQHGDTVEDVDEAHRIAKRAADAGFAPARWLAAASMDRSLMYRGRPQKFGTQIVPDGVRQRVWDVDPSTTDELRRQWGVGPLAQLEAEAARLTREEPMPAPDDAPPWLKDAIARWKAAGTL
jgi:TPR repeat protein